ncbi:MAG: hypothetical protein JWO95_1689 [Verrucomicrobiales bacterium]|nr:hypothetical protein [Verrucomicrobiales bacterium]
MIDWNIQSRSHGCQACEKHFEDKQPYHTILFSDKSEYLRQDICQSCWDTQYGSGTIDKKGFISTWKGLYQKPPAAAPEAMPKENAETLLRKLIEANEPKYGPACYILAVMLERKRVLKVKEQIKKEGTRIFIYEHPASGDIFTITDPNLQLNQLDQVQRDVSSLMEHGINAPQVEAAATVAEGAPIEVAATEVTPDVATDHGPATEPQAVTDPEPAAIT